MSEKCPLSPVEFDVVLYHDRCSDGLGAAYPFWRENKTRYIATKEGNFTPDIRPFQMIGVYDHDNFPEIVKGKNVVVVDFTYTQEATKRMCKMAKTVLTLDHHKTAERNLVGLEKLSNFYYVFDMERSGAQIAWDWVYPDSKRPWFIDYIGDRDLWKFKLPNSDLINTALFYLDYFSWEKMEELYGLDSAATEKKMALLLEQGKVIQHIDRKNIDYSCKSAILCQLGNYKVKLVDNNPHLRSKIGNILANGDDCDFAVCCRYYFDQDVWHASLRGANKSEIDISKVCEMYGGGGHAKAGAFIIHGKNSPNWKAASAEKRKKMPFGTLHDYFKIIEAKNDGK